MSSQTGFLDGCDESTQGFAQDPVPTDSPAASPAASPMASPRRCALEPWGKLIAQTRPPPRHASANQSADAPCEIEIQNVELVKEAVTFGRGNRCDQVLKSESKLVSGEHFKLTRVLERPTGLEPRRNTYITDCSSRNGTFVNSKQLVAHKRRLLHTGDMISFSKLALNHWLFI